MAVPKRLKDLKAPPEFNPDIISYEKYKKDLEIWDAYSDIDKKKKGLAVYLALSEKAQSAVSELDVKELSAETGLETITAKLDDVYLADKNTRAYIAFQKFYECKRGSGEKFEDFIVRFEKLYADLVRHEMKLPEGIRAFFVLNASNMTDDVEKLARATVPELTYDDMKQQIKKICGSTTRKSEEEYAPPLKEDILYASGRRNFRDNRGRGGRGGSREIRVSRASSPSRYDRASSPNRYDRASSPNRYDRSPSNWRSNRSVHWKDQLDTGRKASESATSTGRKNHTNAYGIRLRCFICDSQEHLARDCPNKTDKQVQEINICLLNANPENRQKGLLLESLGRGILDCGCTRTVAGEVWMKQYLESLQIDDKNEVKIDQHSNTIFRFGDGKECKSNKRVTMPVYIGSKRRLLKVEVVDAEIPLLVSKETMKEIGMQLDFECDIATIDGEKIRLDCTSSGHYCMPLNVFCAEAENIVLKMKEIDSLDRKQKLTKALKLHRQFGHAKAKKLLKLVENSHIEDKEFISCINEVCEKCEFCNKYQTPPLQPVVSLPIADNFNQVVCLDLKQVNSSLYILHMIDAATKYTAARLVKSKTKNEIISRIFDMWIAYFGRPNKLMSDNGGEFLNEVYTEASEKLGIEIIMPPADSPFSNGIVERHHKVLYETMMKTMDDTRCEASIALAWACSAKNALLNNKGFSPNQLVFGQNVNLPTVLTDKLPALSPTTSSEIVRKNLEAIHSARVNYQKAENSEKIKRALRHKTRTFAEKEYNNGDEVYYKRRGFRAWKGPARVMGTDKYTILVKHGGSILRCHRSHVTSTKRVHDLRTQERGTIRNASRQEECETEETNATPNEVRQATMPFLLCSDSDSEDEIAGANDDDTEDAETIPPMEEIPDHLVAGRDQTGTIDTTVIVEAPDADGFDHMTDDAVTTDVDSLVEDVDEIIGQAIECLSMEMSDGANADIETSDASDSDVIIETEGEEDCTIAITETEPGTEKPLPNSYIALKFDGKWTRGKVLTQQPKITSKYKHWINIHLEGSPSACSVNWANVVEWRTDEEPERVVLVAGLHESDQIVIDAKNKELKSLRDNQVYEEIDFINQSTISSRWVFTEKSMNGESGVKARLVARGFEESKEQLRTDSPTCSKQGLRSVLISAAGNHWELQSIDVAAAFLQGNLITREVFLRPPPEVCSPDKVWKLRRCIYGLADAPREWYNKVVEELLKLNGIRSVIDPAMFMWYNDTNELIGHLSCHVDDFQFTGTTQWQTDVIDKIKEVFNISKEHIGSFRYLGLNVNQTHEGVSVDQKHYVDNLQEIPVDSKRRKQQNEELTKEERTSLKCLSGQMLWVTSQTRPDLAFETCMMSNTGKTPTVAKIIEANKAVRKLRNNSDVCVKFPDIGSINEMDILAYGDGSHASLADGSSQGAVIVFVRGEGKVAPMLWQSKKLKRISKSPLATETMAVGEAADAGILIANMFKEIHRLEKLPTVTVLTDSKSLIDNLETTNTVEDMSMRVNVARLRQMVEMNEIAMEWVSTDKQLADVMTKKTASGTTLRKVLDGCKL